MRMCDGSPHHVGVCGWTVWRERFTAWACTLRAFHGALPCPVWGLSSSELKGLCRSLSDRGCRPSFFVVRRISRTVGATSDEVRIDLSWFHGARISRTGPERRRDFRVAGEQRDFRLRYLSLLLLHRWRETQDATPSSSRCVLPGSETKDVASPKPSPSSSSTDWLVTRMTSPRSNNTSTARTLAASLRLQSFS